MIDSYIELLTFSLVCKTLSITEAAKELNKSKAHVSRQLSNLEKRIGTTLFYRTTRSLTLTENGLALKNDALSLLSISKNLDYKAYTLSQEISGRFCITIPTSIATSIFPLIILNLKQQFPKITFEIIVSNNVEPLLDKKIDMGIRLGITNDELIAHKVGEYQTILVSSNKTDENKDIKDLTLIVDSFPSKGRLYINSINEEIDINEFKDVILVNETATQLSLIQNGLGVGLVPSFVLSGIGQSNLFRIRSEYCSNPIEAYITYPYQTPLPEKLAAVSSFLREELYNYMNNQ